jgi:hypothetical protein
MRPDSLPARRAVASGSKAVAAGSQAGFINGEAIRSTTSPDRIIEVWPFDLTWQAHEFLAAARDDTVWRKVLRDLGARSIRTQQH